MTNRFFAILSASLFLLFSCGTNSTTEDSTDYSSPKTTKEFLALDNKMELINADLVNATVANSLIYQHNDGSTEEVFAYLNKEKEIIKIEEKFKNGTKGNSGTRFFFLEKGKRFISIERFIDVAKADGKFRERISYYDSNGEVVYTKQRISDYEEYLDTQNFEDAKNYDCSMETAEQVLNQKGLFSTTFQGFATDGPMDYLIVGGPGESGYASALAVQLEDQTIRTLKDNEKSMINKPLIVEFEKMIDERKLEFQVLLSVSIE